MNCCSNCKYARDKFLSIKDDGYALFYCEKKEQILHWNLYTHCCDDYKRQK